MSNYLLLTPRSSGAAIMSRSLEAISGQLLVLCVDKRFVYSYIAPDKIILKSNI